MFEPHHNDFGDRRLRRADLAADPLAQFADWLQEAVDSGEADPCAMVLATNNPEGAPSARTVALKEATAEGFVFTSRADGPKVKELDADARVAVVFYWPGQSRQVRARGTTRRLSDAYARRLFAQRPRNVQLAHHVGTQSEVIEDEAYLEQEIAAMERRFAEGEVPMPDWLAFLIEPNQVEFWQGRSDRLHDRFRYSRQSDGSWQLDRLVP